MKFLLYKKAVINDYSIHSNNVYDNTLGIDFNDIYSEYNHLSLKIWYTAKIKKNILVYNKFKRSNLP